MADHAHVRGANPEKIAAGAATFGEAPRFDQDLVVLNAKGFQSACNG